jgi:hypothetical protein
MKWTEILCEGEIGDDLKNFLIDQIMFLRAQTKNKHAGIDLNKIHTTMVQNGYDIDVEGIKKVVDDYFAKVDGVERNGEELTFSTPEEAGDQMIGQAKQEMGKQNVKRNAVQGAKDAIDGMV